MNIKPIDVLTTQRICSSQVVVTMAAAIKELIENSLDAHCHTIEIRLKNFGADLIEVHDDGDGILPEEFYQFTQRHTTSKFENFEDLNNLDSFGFRGEALNSLCFLGNVHIHTQSQLASVGSLLTLNQFGQVTSVSPLSRQRGTTVSIRNLFHSLPVRRKQFLANLKKEYEKAMNYIISYCLISDNVHILCYKIDKNKQLILSTKGIDGIGGNIEAIFGNKQLKSMIELIVEYDISKDILDEFNLKDLNGLSEIQLSGWVSRPTDVTISGNMGKQYLYINGRPCEIPKIKKLIISCYRILHKSQTPAFVIALSLPKESVDINVEPDKRLLLLDKQPDVLAVIKASILKCFTKCGFSQDCRLMERSLDKSFLSQKSSPVKSNKSVSCSPIPHTISKRCLDIPEVDDLKKIKLHGPILSKLGDKRDVKLSQVSQQCQTSHFSLTHLKHIQDIFHDYNINNSKTNYKLDITPDNDCKAEEELLSIFRKSNFNDLDVIGQFNMGFIVARLHSDLFIIDQHASDERKQFETFLEKCKVTSLPLVCPKRLHITAGDDEIIKEYLQSFKTWGFRFEFRESDLLHDQIFLTAAPCRKNLILGSEDVQEMIQTIKDKGHSSSLMPRRLTSAIASNACRSAIMIGAYLTHGAMLQVLRNLSDLEYPFNCAHGRPTIRHLYCLE